VEPNTPLPTPHDMLASISDNAPFRKCRGLSETFLLRVNIVFAGDLLSNGFSGLVHLFAALQRQTAAQQLQQS